MKKSTTVSPFIMLLVPAFLLVGITVANVNTEIPIEKHKASIKLQTPTFKVLVKSIF